MHDEILLPDFKRTPFWWDESPPEAPSSEPLPDRVDVAVVGGGLAGVFTALHLARGGLEVAVLEGGRLGENASTRNMGAAGRTLRPKFGELESRYGLETAKRVCQEAKDWLEWTVNFIEKEEIDCGFVRNGRINGAHSPAAYAAQAKDLELQSRHMEVETELISADDQRRELGTDVYHGCTVYHDTGQLDPGQFFKGVCERARRSGARLFGGTRVMDVERISAGFQISTSRGTLAAREVVMATNAETGNENSLFRYFRKRVIPFSFSGLVTEPLDPEVLDRIMPTSRFVLETRRLQMGLRRFSDNTRIHVGGQYFVDFKDEGEAAIALMRDLAARYPELAGARVSHAWTGWPCFTRIELPHVGTHEGIHYLHGFNGIGVPVTGYLGNKVAQRILGGPDRETVFAEFPYRAVPGNWYPASSRVFKFGAALYRALDRYDSGLPR
jgi:glycine/D-amino acid oxidase-like deaminating enzyme